MNQDALWIDSHAHLTMFDRDEVPEILERAVKNGVAGVLTPATGGEDLDAVVGLARDYSHRVVAAAGVHVGSSTPARRTGWSRLVRLVSIITT